MSKYKYGKRSSRVLSEVDFDLDLLAREMLAMEIIDIAAICGRRGKIAQEQAFIEGNSKSRWGASAHNVLAPALSGAIDLAPIINGRIPWEKSDPNYKYWYILGGMGMAVIKKLSLKIKWGGFFKSIEDLPHFQMLIVRDITTTEMEAPF